MTDQVTKRAKGSTMTNTTLQEALAYGCTNYAQAKRFAEIKQWEYEAEQARLEHQANIEAESAWNNR